MADPLRDETAVFDDGEDQRDFIPHVVPATAIGVVTGAAVRLAEER